MTVIDLCVTCIPYICCSARRLAGKDYDSLILGKVPHTSIENILCIQMRAGIVFSIRFTDSIGPMRWSVAGVSVGHMEAPMFQTFLYGTLSHRNQRLLTLFVRWAECQWRTMPHRILALKERPEYALALKELIEPHGYEVLIVHTIEEALETLHRVQVSMVCLLYTSWTF